MESYQYIEGDEYIFYLCPSWAISVGYIGVIAAVVLSNVGSAWGTWRSGVSIVHTGIRHPSSIMKNIIPVIMSGVIGIYGLIIAIILAKAIKKPSINRNNSYSIYTAMAHMCAGICCGTSGLVSGGCIGIVGDYGVRAVGYRASQISLFPSTTEKQGYSTIPEVDQRLEGRSDSMTESVDQNKIFIAMLIILIFSEALALYGLIVALIVSQHSYSCGDNPTY